MGKLMSRIWQKRETRILFFGLDAAGKTSILYKLKLGEIVTTIPTIGFNVETLKHKGVTITAWDVGGRDKIRPLYRHYYHNTDAVLFVVDSNDRERIQEALEELKRITDEDELRDAVFVIVANKQDIPNAMKLEEIERHVNDVAWRYNGRPKIFTTSAINGDGLYETLDWLTEQIAIKHTRSRLIPVTDSGSHEQTDSVTKDKSAGSYFTDLFAGFRKLLM